MHPCHDNRCGIELQRLIEYYLLFSLGNGSLEAAVNWVVEDENDSDIDEMPMVFNMMKIPI